MEQQSISLPALPKGKDFEEFIAAYLQCVGYYLERNIIDRGEKELLELDIIIQDFSAAIPLPEIVEIKSGGWGFGDVFKAKGWMCYTNIQKAHFIVQDGREFEFYKQKAGGLGVHLYNVPELKNTTQQLHELLKDQEVADVDISTWRYAFWVEREMFSRIKDGKKHTQMLCYRALDKYNHSVNSGIFFTPNLIERINKLYENFQDHGHLTARCAHEESGGDFTHMHTNLPDGLYAAAFFKGEFSTIQISCYLEFQSKLAILKNAIEYLVLQAAGGESEAAKIQIKKYFGFSTLDLLPNSFKEGLKQLSSHKCFALYPVFWQWFINVFGGFILDDYKDDEYALLSEKTGIDPSEVDNALSALDILFPTNNGWIVKNPKTNIRAAKFFPSPLKGNGANYRRIIYGEGKYENLKRLNSYAMGDISIWNNATFNLLK